MHTISYKLNVFSWQATFMMQAVAARGNFSAICTVHGENKGTSHMQVEWDFQPKYKIQRQPEFKVEEHVSLDNVNFTNAGKYTATVSNGTDDDDKITYTVDVKGMPTFIASCTIFTQVYNTESCMLS